MSTLVKICLLLCLVSASQCTPTFGLLSSIFGHHHHHAVHHHHTGVVVKGPLGILNKLLRSIGDVAKTARNILHEILGISTCNGYGDIGNFIIRVGHAQGNLINQFLPEVGTFFSRLIEAATRIVVCVGLQPVRILFNSPRPPICLSTYGTDFGCLPYKGKYDSCDSVLTGYDLDLHLWLKKLTSSKYSNLKDSVGVIVREIITIIKLTINLKTKIVRDDLLRLFSRVTTILAVLGESLEPNYGVQIVDKCFGLIYKVYGSDYSVCVSERSEAKNRLKECKQTGFDGTLNKDDDDDDDSDDNNAKDKSNNEQGNDDNKKDEEKSGNNKPGPKNDKKNDKEDNNKDKSEGNKKDEQKIKDEHNKDDNKNESKNDNNEDESEKNKKDEHESHNKKSGSEDNKKHDSGNNNEHNEERNDKNDNKGNKNHGKDYSNGNKDKNKDKPRLCECP